MFNPDPLLSKEFKTNLQLERETASTFRDQYGRVLESFTNKRGEQDLRPVGLSPKWGA